MLGTAIAGGVLGLGQLISGISQRKKAQNTLDNLETPELNNAFEGIGIATSGSDLMREENQRMNAMFLDSAQSGGVRSVMGSLPRLSASNNILNQDARKYLDDQIINRNFSIAQDDARIREMNERRYMGDVAGLNSIIQGSRQDMWSGLRGIGTSIMYADRNGLFQQDQDN